MRLPCSPIDPPAPKIQALALRGMLLGCLLSSLSSCGRPEAADAPGESGTELPSTSVQTTDSERGADGAGQASSIAGDSRIQAVFRLSSYDGYFERNLSDPVPILIDRLTTAQSEPLRRAIEELGALGEESIEALRREVERGQRDAAEVGPLQNVVTALSLNDSPRSAGILLELLGHPHTALRAAVLRALGGLELTPEHASRLEWAVLSERGKGQVSAAYAFSIADPDRAALRFAEWLEADQLNDALDTALLHLAAHAVPDDGGHADRLAALAPELPASRGAYLYARLAAEGNQEAQSQLVEIAESGDPAEHRAAVQGAFAAGLVDLLAAVAGQDPNPGQRVAAVTALGRLLEEEGPNQLTEPDDQAAAKAALRRALDDPQIGVREEALVFGVRLGEPEAVERALAGLDGSQRDLTVAAPALAQAMADDPALTERALDRLLARLEREAHLSINERLPVLQILGLVPHRRAAETLIELGRSSEGTLETLPAHEFLSVAASNTGPKGRTVLAEALTEETDPNRRLDLIWAITSARDDLARDVLEEHVEREGLDPYERLYAASCLAQVGPTVRVAPRLKRVALRMDGEPRRGMNRLLNYWYGRS